MKSIVEIASSLPPKEWPKNVLAPITGLKISIFGTRHFFPSGGIISLIDALILVGLCKSKGEARNYIESGAVSISGIKTRDTLKIITAADALPNLDAVVIELGKRNYGIIELRE